MELFENIIQSLDEAILVLNAKGKIIFWNRRMALFTGISGKKAKGRFYLDIFPEWVEIPGFDLLVSFANEKQLSMTFRSNEKPVSRLNASDEDKTVSEISQWGFRANILPGKTVMVSVAPVSGAVSPESLPADTAALVDRLAEEVSLRKMAEENLKRVTTIIENTMEGVLVTDTQGVVVDVNPAFTEITGYGHDEVIGHNVSILKSGKHDKQYYQNLWGSLLNKGFWRGEFVNRKPNGELFIIDGSIVAIKNDEGKTTHYVNVFHEITKRKKNELLLKKLSTTDELTGLANRRKFNQELEKHWYLCMRHTSFLSIVMLDVDFFKAYNDRYGHPQGDLVLVKIAYVLSQHTRRSGDLAARIGGEEFVLLLPGTPLENAAQIVEGIFKELEELAIRHEHSTVAKYVTLSAGLAGMIPINEYASPEELIEKADKALYAAKRNGRNRMEIIIGIKK